MMISLIMANGEEHRIGVPVLDDVSIIVWKKKNDVVFVRDQSDARKHPTFIEKKVMTMIGISTPRLPY